jgi:DNA-directed RNA polymerase specialized sigma24 family protein
VDIKAVHQRIGRDADAERFARFAERLQPKLRTALIASVGIDVAGDALSEAMEYGWRHWDRIRDMENPEGYMWAVGRSKGRSLLRSRNRWQLAHRVTPLPPAPNPTPWVEPGLPTAMAALSERQRVSVFLLHGHDWPHSEVAAFLGVSIPTVQKHAERGMAKLRKALGAEA